MTEDVPNNPALANIRKAIEDAKVIIALAGNDEVIVEQAKHQIEVLELALEALR
jgi:hypothetical protein